ncbi:Uncharacterised protein [Mycobacterium tuberculosis]|nr:Uncharacterised protein [Mycobacterium tuberculosis]
MDPGELQMVREVVRPKTPRGASRRQTQNPERGPETSEIQAPRHDHNASSDPKPREGTSRRQTQNPERGPETLRRRIRDLFPRIGRQTQNPERGQPSSDPKPREGTGNLQHHHHPAPQLSMSSDPKPREGTGNPTMASKSAWVTDPGRQTQNPERGPAVVRPKTPRGDRKRPVDGGCVVRASVVRPKTPRGDQPSSDPKPREGTGNWTQNRTGCGRCSSRQTQNPERGPETHIARHTTATLLLHVLRPKTPRGDGNPHGGTWTSATIGVVGPKTTRGDGNLNRPSRGVSAVPESSDPKPREGTETTTTGSPPRLLTGIQDEHDGGVDGEDVWS